MTQRSTVASAAWTAAGGLVAASARQWDVWERGRERERRKKRLGKKFLSGGRRLGRSAGGHRPGSGRSCLRRIQGYAEARDAIQHLSHVGREIGGIDRLHGQPVSPAERSGERARSLAHPRVWTDRGCCRDRHERAPAVRPRRPANKSPASCRPRYRVRSEAAGGVSSSPPFPRLCLLGSSSASV